jgi:hypothetical protein
MRPLTSNLEKILLTKRGTAYNPATGESFVLGGPAAHLVRMLQNGADTDDLLIHLLDNYEVDETTARRDLDTFLVALKQMKWVEVGSS